MNLMWFTIIYKYSAKINKNEKDKTAFKTAHNHVRDVICMVSKFEGCILPGFEVEGWKTDFCESWGT